MAFRPAAVTFRGSVRVNAPLAEAFALFSPEGERGWVPGWDPELLHPAGAAWAEGQIFRTREEFGDAIWIVTRLDSEARRVEYHRVEPGRYVARVEVQCLDADTARASGAMSDRSSSSMSAPAETGRTIAEVVYTFIGLSEPGNAEIAAMTEEAYAQKMKRWAGWIEKHLAGIRDPRLATVPPSSYERGGR